MKRWSRLAVLAGMAVLSVSASSCRDASAAATEMVVYATPTCGCCGAWIEHMRENGFVVTEVLQNDLSEIRARHRLPAALMSCHIGVVDGFAIEGHVPASVVRRLLHERPEVLGISAPGMPIGSPDMEVPDGTREPFEVISWDETGPLRVFEFVN